jgi:RNA polymerase sigma-70 factor (ECF subfamily)
MNRSAQRDWVVPGRAAPAGVVDDGELMAQVQAGSTEALGQLFDRYYTRVYRIALVICGSRELAEDAVQNAFVSIWTGRRGFLEQRGTVAAWLLASVRYRAIDLIRHRARRVAPLLSGDEFDSVEASEDTAAEVASHIEAEHVRALLAQLPAAQQEVIMLAFYGGLTHAEIAAQLSLPSGTVKGRMRLGLRKLRDSLEPVERTLLESESPAD